MPNPLGPLASLVTGYAMSYRFEVKVSPTSSIGFWAKLDGLQMDFQYAQYIAGMNPDERSHISAPMWNYPTRLKYKEVSVTRPLTAAGVYQTAKWLDQMKQRPAPSMGQIVMFDAGGLVPVWWVSLLDIQPSTWSGPSMDTEGSKPATETLTLVHQGMIFPGSATS